MPTNSVDGVSRVRPVRQGYLSLISDKAVKKTVAHRMPDAPIPETTEQRAARLLRQIGDPAQPLDALQAEELHLIADLLTSRARSWKHLAHTLSERARAVEQESERVQTLAAALADAAERFLER